METPPIPVPDTLDVDRPFITDLRPQTDGIAPVRVWIALGVVVVGVFVAMYVALARRAATAAPVATPEHTAPAMTGSNPPLEHFVKIPTSFEGMDRRPPAQPTPPPIPRAEKLAEVTPPPLPPPAPPAPPKAPEPKAPATPPVSTPPAPQTAPTPPRPAKRWLFANTGQQLGKPLFAQEKPQPHATREEESKAHGLIQTANWVRPADPTGILYRGTPIHALLLRNVNSDIPGDVPFYIDRDVTDSLGQGRVLIPQHSKGIGKQVSKPQAGDSRLPITVEQIRFPDGRLLTFKGQLGDKSGAVGVPGDVDNHIPALLLKVGLSTLLSIGARIPFGSPDQQQYHPNLAQEAAEDASSQINRAGQRLVEQQLSIAPTIRAKAGDQITLELQENVNLNHHPKVVR